MADLKISQLTGASTPLAGTEVLPIVQSGLTVKVSVANLTAGRAVASAGGAFSDNFVQGTAAKGVNFTANTPSSTGTMTSQLLNWYEEGTWTPAITAGSGTITAYTSAGYYTRIGRQVFLSGTISISNNGTGGTSVNIGSLPFAISGGVAGGIARENQVNGATSSITASGSTGLVMFKYDNTYPAGSGTAFQFSVAYFV